MCLVTREIEDLLYFGGSHPPILQLYFYLLCFLLRFNPAPTFLGITFDCRVFSSTHVTQLKANFFPCLKPLRCIYSSLQDTSEKSLFLNRAFIQSIFVFVSSEWFSFLIMEWPAASSSAASHPLLMLFLFMTCVHLPYESP